MQIFIHIYYFVFEIQTTKNCFADPKRFRDFLEPAPGLSHLFRWEARHIAAVAFICIAISILISVQFKKKTVAFYLIFFNDPNPFIINHNSDVKNIRNSF